MQVLKIPYAVPNLKSLVNFLEINGKYLREFYVHRLPILFPFTKFCPNLKKFDFSIEIDVLENLKTVFNDCQYLESIRIWCETRGD